MPVITLILGLLFAAFTAEGPIDLPSNSTTTTTTNDGSGRGEDNPDFIIIVDMDAP